VYTAATSGAVRLTLRILSPVLPPEAASSHVFDEGGGSIGRAADNTWELPDTKVSRWHAVISFKDGTFFIEDLSRNGVCLNDWNNRIAGGCPHPLRAGDTLFIDPYEIGVALETGAGPSA
jgi:type VI secretion system protein ImpI